MLLNKLNLQEGMMMNANNEDHSFDYDKVEKWLENYFLDPLTSYYDQTQFRIDLYETDREWIVEALLPDFTCSDITVYVEEEKLFITGKKKPPSTSIAQIQHIRSRSIEFPFQINSYKIKATFHNGILEVFISKLDKDHKKNRFITLP
jgi:spore coat protein M/HSP20 family protein